MMINEGAVAFPGADSPAALRTNIYTSENPLLVYANGFATLALTVTGDVVPHWCGSGCARLLSGC